MEERLEGFLFGLETALTAKVPYRRRVLLHWTSQWNTEVSGTVVIRRCNVNVDSDSVEALSERVHSKAGSPAPYADGRDHVQNSKPPAYRHR